MHRFINTARKLSGWPVILHRRRRIYLVSDLHLDHDNIIKYCHRPFPNVNEMNRLLVRNWNEVVKNHDKVYFLGDLCSVRKHRPPRYWLKRLKGEKVLIKGSHDRNITHAKRYKILNYNGYKFLLVHNPNRIPFKFDGWVIHGHIHNNSMYKYPFINGVRKTINVSVELVDYRPISIDTILKLGIDSIKRMETIKSKPERW